MEYFEIILKTIIIYFVVLIIIRMLGKREIGEISIFDLVVLLILADVAVLGVQDGYNILLAIVALFSLLFLQKSLAILVMKLPKIRKILDGKESIIIINGKLNLDEMRKQHYNIDDLITQTREQGVLSLDEILLAILESSGELSIFKKSDYKVVILPVIISGELQLSAIEYLKLKMKVLKQYLDDNELSIQDIYYLASDGTNFFSIESLNDER